jgi:ribosomal protein L34E
VFEHRIIMENHIGRLLDDNEVVHHIDGYKKNNVIENLKIMTLSEHTSLHMKRQNKKLVELKCPLCKTIFIKEKRSSFLSNKRRYSCCSLRCGNKFAWNLRIFGETEENLKAISENLIREFNKEKIKENIKNEINEEQRLKITDLKRYNKEILNFTYKKYRTNYSNKKISYVRTPRKIKSVHKIKKEKTFICKKCNNIFNSVHDPKYCSYKCAQLSSRKCERPTCAELQDLLSKNSMEAIGRMFGVAGAAVKKWKKLYQKEIENKQD